MMKEEYRSESMKTAMAKIHKKHKDRAAEERRLAKELKGISIRRQFECETSAKGKDEATRLAERDARDRAREERNKHRYQLIKDREAATRRTNVVNSQNATRSMHQRIANDMEVARGDAEALKGSQ